jgi:hypothetical protein
LRRFFINNEKSRYVLVGFYPAHDYQILVEFGGSRIQSIKRTYQHVSTLAEHLPELYDSVYLGKRYDYKDDEFRLQCSGTDSVFRMYLTIDSFLLKVVMYVILWACYILFKPRKLSIPLREMTLWRMLFLRKHLASLLNLSQLFADSYCTTNFFTNSNLYSYKTIVWQIGCYKTYVMYFVTIYLVLVWLVSFFISHSWPIPAKCSAPPHIITCIHSLQKWNTDRIPKPTHPLFLGTRSHSDKGLWSAGMARGIP